MHRPAGGLQLCLQLAGIGPGRAALAADQDHRLGLLGRHALVLCADAAASLPPAEQAAATEEQGGQGQAGECHRPQRHALAGVQGVGGFVEVLRRAVALEADPLAAGGVDEAAAAGGAQAEVVDVVRFAGELQLA
ncbi:hypothetical protein D3C78_1376780 [compost metagenome]